MADDLVRASRVLSIAVLAGWLMAVVTDVADAVVRYRGAAPGTSRLRLEAAMTFSAPLVTALLVLGLALVLLDPDRRLVQGYVAAAALAVVAAVVFLLAFLTGPDRNRLEAARIGAFLETLAFAGVVFYVGQQWLGARVGAGPATTVGPDDAAGSDEAGPVES